MTPFSKLPQNALEKAIERITVRVVHITTRPFPNLKLLKSDVPQPGLADRLNGIGENAVRATLPLAKPISACSSVAGRCLFLINGLGMGNSTRCHAIIEQLVERRVRVDVLTSGNGLAYFANRPEPSSLIPTRGFHYSSRNGHVSGLHTAASLFNHYRIGRQKQGDLETLLTRLPVDVIVTDSEYSTAPARRMGIPVIGLNNSDLVVAEYLRKTRTPPGTRSHFWLVEYSDYLFHRFRCDAVISPSPQAGTSRHPRIHRVGLIVRRAVRAIAPQERADFSEPRSIRSVVFMLSGSTFASAVDFGDGKLPFRVDVVGRDGQNLGNVVFHGRLMDNIHLLQHADALVINGGFSAVSEAIALNKPTFVIPVPGHAEQYVNARLVSDLGLGYLVTAQNVVEKLLHLHDTNRWDGLAARTPITGIDGASEAADIICEHIRRQHHSGQQHSVASPSPR